MIRIIGRVGDDPLGGKGVVVTQEKGGKHVPPLAAENDYGSQQSFRYNFQFTQL